MKRNLSLILLIVYSMTATPGWCGPRPIFAITPLVAAPTQAIQGQTSTAIYQVFNNSPFALNSLSVVNFPVGITQVTTTDPSYCNTNPFSLAVNASCLLKVKIDTNLTSTAIQWNPEVCINPGRTYCSKAYPSDQVGLILTPGPIPQDCTSNASNFNYELAQQFDSGSIVIGWGIPPVAIQSNLNSCATGDVAGTLWQQQRLLDAAAFWISQKINYCHHYMPDWKTPVLINAVRMLQVVELVAVVHSSRIWIRRLLYFVKL